MLLHNRYVGKANIVGTHWSKYKYTFMDDWRKQIHQDTSFSTPIYNHLNVYC